MHQRREPDRKYAISRRKTNVFRGNKYVSNKSPSVKLSTDKYNLIIEQDVFRNIAEVIACKHCGGSVQFKATDFQGLAFQLRVSCEECNEIGIFSSSKNLAGDRRKEINMRATLGARMLGVGTTGLKNLSAFMNLPPPVTQKTYELYNKLILESCNRVATRSTSLAADTEVNLSNSRNELGVSGDGSWRRAGFSSLQGVCTLIGAKSGMVLDYVVKNSICKQCDYWKKKLTRSEFEDWFENHEPDCTINHTESSGAMEKNGILEMFKRSEDLHKVRYSHYIGDGDSSTFKNLTNASPYGDGFTLSKKECVGHVHKRLGTRLREMKRINGNKRIGGAGKLTAKYIETLSSYYGKAIRENSHSVEEMYRAIWAIYLHESSTDEEPLHKFCPIGEASWCKFQQAVAKNDLGNFKHKKTMPKQIWELIKPIFESMSNKDLLERCLGGHTQNNNESINSKIWKLAPKKSFSGFITVQIATAIAVITFNAGAKGLLQICEDLGLESGPYMRELVAEMDNSRIKNNLVYRKTRKNDSLSDSETSEEESYGAGTAD